MRIPRIYTAQDLQGGVTLLLEPEPSHHLSRVLRLETGNALVLFNGNGGEYPAEITAVGKKQVEVSISEERHVDLESPLQIHLGIAISRGDRMDWIVQKSAELGAQEITPLFTERTEVRLKGERADKKVLHWQQVAISACEQCGRNRVPAVHPLQNLQSWLEGTDAERKFVLHHRADGAGISGEPPASVALLIGPEGGLAEEEIESAQQAEFETLRLGPRVLRTETAPLTAIAVLQSQWGDMAPGQSPG